VCMEVGVKGDNHCLLIACERNDLCVLGACHAEFSYVNAYPATLAQESGRVARQSLVQEQPHIRGHCRLRGRCFQSGVFEAGSSEREGLPNVLRIQFVVVAEEVVAIRIHGQRFDDATDSQTHPTNAGLSVHLVRVPGNAVEALHEFI
jgi:hypothetical protein